MRIIYLLLFTSILSGCAKEDIYNRYVEKFKPHCQVVSMNADKQGTNDFFMIKTIDSFGKVLHLYAQLKDVAGDTYIYDYRISYDFNKAVFSGTTTKTYWYLVNEEDMYQEDPPFVRANDEVVNTRPFEILRDGRNGNATRVRYADDKFPILDIVYDEQSFVDSIIRFSFNKELNFTDTTFFDVATDARGNILKILAHTDSATAAYYGNLGVFYSYDNSSPVSHENYFYEAPNMFVSEMYSLLEILDWGPFQPNIKRTGADIYWTYPPDEIDLDPFISATYEDQQFDASGKLTGYRFNGQTRHLFNPIFSFPFVNRNRSIEWSCPGSPFLK